MVKVDRSEELVASEFAAVLRQCAAVAANYVAQCDHADAALAGDEGVRSLRRRGEEQQEQLQRLGSSLAEVDPDGLSPPQPPNRLALSPANSCASSKGSPPPRGGGAVAAVVGFADGPSPAAASRELRRADSINLDHTQTADRMDRWKQRVAAHSARTAGALPSAQGLRTLLEEPESSRGARALDLALNLLVLASATVTCLETVPALVRCPDGDGGAASGDAAGSGDVAALGNDETFLPQCARQLGFFAFEAACTALFTLEIVLRLAVSRARLRHCCSPFFAIDVASVLPFYLALAVPHSTAYLLALRAIRVLRLLRILKIGRHWFGVQIVGALVAHSSSALLLCFLFFVASTIVISSALWAIESEAHCRVAVGGGSDWETCPDAELRPTEGFESIGHAFWFTAVTLTTVGYGDVTPWTGGGRALAIAAALSGIVVIAMPIAVVGTQFTALYNVYIESQKQRLLRLLDDQAGAGGRRLSIGETMRDALTRSPARPRRRSVPKAGDEQRSSTSIDS